MQFWQVIQKQKKHTQPPIKVEEHQKALRREDVDRVGVNNIVGKRGNDLLLQMKSKQ